MRITFHVSQMPNVICETNMKREFKFSKNVPLTEEKFENRNGHRQSPIKTKDRLIRVVDILQNLDLTLKLADFRLNYGAEEERTS